MDHTIDFRIGLTSSNIGGLQNKLMSISTPGSQTFRQWLSPGKYAHRVFDDVMYLISLYIVDEVKSFLQPSSASLAAFDSFAKANDLQVTTMSPSGDWLSFATTVGRANTLFGANFESFTHESMAEPLIRTLSVSLPEELVGHVEVIHPTTSFEGPNIRFAPFITSANDKRGIPASCNSTITPSCLQELYGIPTTPATQKSNSLLVTAYQNASAQRADIAVSLLL